MSELQTERKRILPPLRSAADVVFYDIRCEEVIGWEHEVETIDSAYICPGTHTFLGAKHPVLCGNYVDHTAAEPICHACRKAKANVDSMPKSLRKALSA